MEGVVGWVLEFVVGLVLAMVSCIARGDGWAKYVVAKKVIRVCVVVPVRRMATSLEGMLLLWKK